MNKGLDYPFEAESEYLYQKKIEELNKKLEIAIEALENIQTQVFIRAVPLDVIRQAVHSIAHEALSKIE